MSLLHMISIGMKKKTYKNPKCFDLNEAFQGLLVSEMFRSGLPQAPPEGSGLWCMSADHKPVSTQCRDKLIQYKTF